MRGILQEQIEQLLGAQPMSREEQKTAIKEFVESQGYRGVEVIETEDPRTILVNWRNPIEIQIPPIQIRGPL